VSCNEVLIYDKGNQVSE